jgi:hypothetical protein
MKLITYDKLLAITQLPNGIEIPAWVFKSEFINIFKNCDEFSIVTDEKVVPKDLKTEWGWNYLKIQGPIPFDLTGVLNSVLEPLAQEKLGIFAISTYDTDYILVKKENFSKAKEALKRFGHNISDT